MISASMGMMVVKGLIYCVLSIVFRFSNTTFKLLGLLDGVILLGLEPYRNVGNKDGYPIHGIFNLHACLYS